MNVSVWLQLDRSIYVGRLIKPDMFSNVTVIYDNFSFKA